MSTDQVMEEGLNSPKEGNCKEINVGKETSQEVDEDMEDLHCEDSKDFEVESKKKQEEAIKKKYGGLLPKKPPLISKDHEHAFFDSADWALGKKNKGPLEALRPKLQPSPHHQARSRSAYGRDEDIANVDNKMNPEQVQKSDEDAKPENNSLETESSCHSSEN